MINSLPSGSVIKLSALQEKASETAETGREKFSPPTSTLKTSRIDRESGILIVKTEPSPNFEST